MKKLTGETLRKLPRKKKIVLAVGVAAVLVAVLGAAVGVYASNTVQKNVIGSDAAVSIALDDANVPAEEARIDDVDLNLRQGTLIYDVEFAAGQVDYDYEIKASDGAILNRFAEVDGESVEIGNAPADTAGEDATQDGGQQAESTAPSGSAAAQSTTAAQTTAAQNGNSGSSSITLEKAKSIALGHVGLSASDVRFTKAKTDQDDGVKEYDIEFVSGNYAYEFEIRASDGKIISYDREQAETKGTTASGSTAAAKYIGVDKAKSIALKDSGVSASNASFVKAKLEEDDGIYVYEIEFYSGGMEYDYEIDAKTGKILDRSVERADDD
ncbi:MAG: PepSY domain-containing protein [Clostridiales bacterium]|nr:PepSY domain-containing protein [Clostridiales bacterium]